MLPPWQTQIVFHAFKSLCIKRPDMLAKLPPDVLDPVVGKVSRAHNDPGPKLAAVAPVKPQEIEPHRTSIHHSVT